MIELTQKSADALAYLTSGMPRAVNNKNVHSKKQQTTKPKSNNSLSLSFYPQNVNNKLHYCLLT